MNEFTELSDELMDELLAQRPRAAAPPDFTKQVMTRIQSVSSPATRAPVHFRLEPLDIALPVLLACLVILGLGLTGQLAFLGVTTPVDWSVVRPAVTLPLPGEWLAAHWLVLVGLFVFAEIALGLLFCAWIWLDQPPHSDRPFVRYR